VKLAIKIDIHGRTPALIGAPCLADLLEAQAAGGTFMFSVGPDRSGTHLGRFFRRGMPRRFWRTRRIRHFSIASVLYGTLLPAPDLGELSAEFITSIRDRGFETGVHGYDHIEWRERAGRQESEWIGRQLSLACQRYQDIAGERPQVHAAPGWQYNRTASRLSQRHEIAYGSDTRGTHPYIPVFQAEVISCPQLPTTLPTLDELIAQHALSPDDAVARLLEMTQELADWGHVYSANAGFEGLSLLPQFEQLLRGWRQQGYEMVSLRDYLYSFETRELPYHEVVTGEVPGRPGTVALQGKAFPGPATDSIHRENSKQGDTP